MNADSGSYSWESAVAWLRAQPDQTQLVADCYYDDPLLAAADRYWHSEEWQDVQALLIGRSGNALDIGAGRGIASFALAKDGFSVTALEPDPSTLVGVGAIRALAAESRLPIRIVEQFSERLPFTDESFDLVFGRAVLHHTRDLEAACRECFRVLKPNGLFVAVREHVISRREDLPRFLEQHPLHRLYGGESAFLLREYESAIKRAGFSSLDVLSPWQTAINFAPYGFEALKDELARRACGKAPALARLTRAILDQPAAWSIARKALERFDQRPGRLYSFVALRS
jgi:SAM-dependent methyltransferase